MCVKLHFKPATPASGTALADRAKLFFDLWSPAIRRKALNFLKKTRASTGVTGRTPRAYADHQRVHVASAMILTTS
jgi:hypothetical protein